MDHVTTQSFENLLSVDMLKEGEKDGKGKEQFSVVSQKIFLFSDLVQTQRWNSFKKYLSIETGKSLLAHACGA